MDKIKIRGGRPLVGEIAISGSKNAALPLMAASLLSQETLTLTKDAGQTIRITVKVRVEAWILDGNPLGLILAQGPKALSPTPTGARPGRAWMRRRDTRLAQATGTGSARPVRDC